MKKVEQKNEQPFGVQRPKTLDEFRDNLKKYYVCIGDMLYVQEGEMKIDQISDFSSIYKKTNTGIGGNGSSPHILPKVRLTELGQSKWDDGDPEIMSGKFFHNEENYTIVENQKEFLKLYWGLMN